MGRPSSRGVLTTSLLLAISSGVPVSVTQEHGKIAGNNEETSVAWIAGSTTVPPHTSTGRRIADRHTDAVRDVGKHGLGVDKVGGRIGHDGSLP